MRVEMSYSSIDFYVNKIAARDVAGSLLAAAAIFMIGGARTLAATLVVVAALTAMAQGLRNVSKARPARPAPPPTGFRTSLRGT